MQLRLLGVVAAVAVALGGLAFPAAGPVRAASAVCTGWTSTVVPPPTIRVYRTKAKRTETVPFRTYVEKVMAAEWGPTNPPAALQIGAVAIKQYAWVFARRWRGGSDPTGQCFDVVDSSRDQVYDPSRTPKPALLAAVTATWKVSLRKGENFFMTGYRPGTGVCDASIDGWRLYQRDATNCVRRYGDNAESLARRFFGGVSWTVPGANDYTGDGRGDLAVVSTDATTGTVTSQVFTADAAFRAAAAAGPLARAALSLAPPGQVLARAAGDVTGDGRTDLVELVRTEGGVALDVLAATATGTAPAVRWWESTADPTPVVDPVANPAPDPAIPAPALALVVTDVDGDGRADAGIIRTRAGDPALGTAPETSLFVAAATTDALAGPRFAALVPAWSAPIDLTSATFLAGDVTGDGRGDLVVLAASPDTGGTTIQVAASMPVLPLQPLMPWGSEAAALPDLKALLADVNRDGRDDVVVIRHAGDPGIQVGVQVAAGSGLGFTPADFSGILPIAFASTKWSSADLTGDGRSDLVVLVDRGLDEAGAPRGTDVLRFNSTGTSFTVLPWFGSATLRWDLATPY